MLEQKRIAPKRRIEDATRNTRSMASSVTVIASTGVASTRITLVEYCAQTNRGNRNQVIPGARNLWMVTMKLSPVNIEEKPTIKTPKNTRTTCVLENSGEKGV